MASRLRHDKFDYDHVQVHVQGQDDRSGHSCDSVYDRVNRSRVRVWAFRFSSSRFRRGALVVSEQSKR